MDFYEKIINGQKRALNSNYGFDIIDSIDTSFLEKVNLKFCKYVLGTGKKAVNIAARAELAQYPIYVFVKLQVLKYMSRMSNSIDNQLLHDSHCLSKKLHSKGIYSCYTFAENIQKNHDIDEQELQVLDYQKDTFS